jgi:MinD-like ATPase involved in chromosome partitioning or flagellar assembly
MERGAAMGKVLLVLADLDHKYVELFTSYIRSYPYNEHFECKSFTNRERLTTYLSNKASKINIMLAGEGMELYDVQEEKVECMLSLKDTPARENPSIIFKYQPLNRLLFDALSIYKEQRKEGEDGTKAAGTRVISVVSASGGCGKTTFALNLSKMLTERGFKVFYLNVEGINSYESLLPMSGKDGWAKFLYYLKTKPEQIDRQWAAIKEYDPFTKIEYFQPPQSCQEIEAISPELMRDIILKIIHQGVYDFIVVDTDYVMRKSALGSLMLSDKVIWLITNDIRDLHRTKIAINEIGSVSQFKSDDWKSKLCFVLNKSLGSPQNDLETNEIEVVEKLPYVPEWKALRHARQLFREEHYNQRVEKLYNCISGRAVSGG